MIRQLFPILVCPEAIVPRLMVTHSLIVTLSPITASDSSPPNFRSCGTAEITAPGNMLQFFPIRAPSMIVTLEPIQVPSPMTTLL